MPTLAFHLDVTRPADRELLVRATWTGPVGGDAEFFLPTWTPGSYLLREYARHVSSVRAFAPGTEDELPCEKIQKNRWRAATRGGAVELRYRVYAHELTVRTADVDAHHAYWNHTCALLWPVGHERTPADIVVDHPLGWRLCCSLPHETREEDGRARCTLRAADLDDALDAPVLVGDTERRTWSVDDVPHAIELDGLEGVAPPPSMADDLRAICEAAKAVFGGALPYESYLFQALFCDQGYGGLEHRDSSTLLMPRTSLTTEKGYREFLGLAAHELFHAWNVKRLRPAELWSYDYEQENYTRMLWLMEGWTAYYDDLLVARAGLSTESTYLASMAKNVQGMRSAPGRFALSLEESSFDAWIRLYRPDENTRNSSQNYYGNGAVAAMCLDLGLRRATGGQRSLDDVLRQLWRETFEQQRGYELEDVRRAVTEVGGSERFEELREMVTGPFDPALEDVLSYVGVRLETRDDGKPFLGIAFRANSTFVASVTRDEPAFRGGVAPGDELLAVQQLRVTSDSWQTVFAAVAEVGAPVELTVARRGVLRKLRVTPAANPGRVQLVADEGASPAQLEARAAWLGATRAAAAHG